MLADDISEQFGALLQRRDVHGLLTSQQLEQVRTIFGLIRNPNCVRYEYDSSIKSLSVQIRKSLVPILAKNETQGLNYQSPELERFVQWVKDIFLPSQIVWFEGPYVTGKIGYLMIGDDDLKHFELHVFSRNTGEIVVRHTTTVVKYTGYGNQFDYWNVDGSDHQPENALIANIWHCLALCSIIGERRIANVQPIVRSRLDKARKKKRRNVFLQMNTVTMTTEAKDARFVSEGGSGIRKALHHVRAFIRLRRGKLELVRPHWRGSYEIGVTLTQHRLIV